MTAAETHVTAPAPPSGPSRADRLALLARCEAWCTATSMRHTTLAHALSGNPSLLTYLPDRAITADTYARCVEGLDMLTHLDVAAGPFMPAWRVGARGEEPAAAREALRERVEALGAALGVRPALLAVAITRDATLLHARGGVSDAQFRAYSARLDRIEAAL